MESPLAKWMKEKDIDQGELARAAGVDRPEVCRTVNAKSKGTRRLRALLAEVAPSILNDQDSFYAVCNEETLQKLAAA